MLTRALVVVAAFSIAPLAAAQVALAGGFPTRQPRKAENLSAESAWLDLRQTAAARSSTQSAPRWVESITLVPLQPQNGGLARTVFRIRIKRPQPDLQLLLFRIFFDDKAQHQPSVVVWDESGTQVLNSGPLGGGIELATSETILLPMIGASCIDVDVAGDGMTVRGVFMDWMTSRTVAHPLAAERRDFVPEPFAAAAPLKVPEQDREDFGTVTATLSTETIRIGASVQTGAAFQFGVEAQPLMALLSFEVASAQIESPPEVFVNGENLGPVSVTLADLADPAYRGESKRLLGPMRFRYTGWLRAQKLIPAASLRVGTNDVIVIGGPGTAASAIRATQLQLKYLWDKSDYLLDPH